MSIDIEKFMQDALAAGFTDVGTLDVSTITLLPQVREACEADHCPAYNKNWACPPGCGTLAECDERIKKYSRGVILQTTGNIEDDYDWEGMQDIMAKHRETFYAFADKMLSEHPEITFIGDGHCTWCEKCTYPDAPCIHPEKMISSMEALGMYVNKVCELNKMKYYYGANTMTYTGCVLLD